MSLEVLRSLFYIKFDSQVKKEIRNSFYYCLKFNSIILLLGIFLIGIIDKSSNPNWLFILKNQGISYFYPSLLLPSQLIFITLGMLPLIILSLTLLYFCLALVYCNSQYLNVIKCFCLRYSLTYSLLYLCRKTLLLFIGFEFFLDQR